MSAAMLVPLSHHGPSGRTVVAKVEAEEGVVYLDLNGETDDEVGVSRHLDADEARTLAAALVHFANEVER